jgi:cytochrome b
MNTETEVVPALEGTGRSASREAARPPETAASDARRLVWDLPLRLFHWLFAGSILASWATAEAGFGWMKWHIRLGYWMIGLLSFRVLWGFVGPRHARFSSFLRGPRGIWRYARGMAGVDEDWSTAGHNPLGGIMVIIMLLLVSFQVSTGLFATDDIVWTGPYYPTVSSATAHVLTHLHHLNFNLIWAAIALHISAIIFYAVVKRHNLVWPMITGHKPAQHVAAHEEIPHSALLRALFVMILSALIVYAVLSGAPKVTASALSFD